jgi:hypothetical protein
MLDPIRSKTDANTSAGTRLAFFVLRGGTAMLRECKNDACRCAAAPAFGYCSIFCKLADQHPGELFRRTCGCHHPGCR